MGQTEVMVFLAREICPATLLSTVALAKLCNTLILGHKTSDNDSLQDAGEDDGTRFLEVWEEHVHPVLALPSNQAWAHQWTGGHITY